MAPRYRRLALLLVGALLLVDAARVPQHLEVRHVMDSMGSLLDFLLARSEHVGVDTLFGVVLARSQLAVLGKHLRRPGATRGMTSLVLRRLDQLEGKCEAILNMHRLHDGLDSQKPTSRFGRVADRLLRPELWSVDAPFRSGVLGPHPTGPRALVAPVDSGTPDEAQSDRCLAEVLELREHQVQPRCNVTQECREWEHNGMIPTGYPLTHRLLYLQTVRQLGCEDATVRGGTRRLCGLILMEAQSIAGRGFPAHLRDLFTEQVALCGIEGFVEFLTPEWRAALLAWQRPEGCFGQRLDPGIHNRIPRSDVSPEGSGCSSHMDGVAAAALAVNLRAMIDSIVGVA